MEYFNKGPVDIEEEDNNLDYEDLLLNYDN